MEFTKDELRMIETMAYSQAIMESRVFLDLMNKAIEKGDHLEYFDEQELIEKKSRLVDKSKLAYDYFKKAQEKYDELMTLSAKAGKMSESSTN